MKFSPLLKAVAVASAVLMLATACGDDSNGNDSDDNGDGYDGEGLPASDMTDWDVDCDWYFLDDLEDFLVFEEWTVGPMEAGFGAGTAAHGLTCEGSYTWPEFETPHGRNTSVNATYTSHIYPGDDSDIAAEYFDERIENRTGDRVDEDVIDEGAQEGSWDQSFWGVYDLDTTTHFLTLIQHDDFVLEISTYVPNDPTERYEESELVPGEWAGYEFTQDEAIEFFFEEQLPKTHDQFLTLLERKE